MTGRVLHTFDTLLQDVKYFLRMLRKTPGFTAMALLTLALGIGANTAIFSVIEGVLVRSLNYREPDRLFTIREVVPSLSHLYPTLPANPRHVAEWQKRCTSFEDMAEVELGTAGITGTGDPEQLAIGSVSWNFFQVLGVQPHMGRTFVSLEGEPGHEGVVVLTDSLWRRRFGANDQIIGTVVRLDGQPYEIIGVLSGSFRPPMLETSGRLEQPPEIFKPLAINLAEIPNLGEFDYEVIARTRAGVTQNEALADLNTVQGQISAQLPNKTELRATIKLLQESIVGSAREGLLFLFAAVGVVLLIVCVNLANLLLARASRRRRESAIRLALGATRSRLLQQSLTESIVLALMGGAIGMLLAYWSTTLLVNSAPVDLPRLNEVRLNWSVLLFALLASTLAGVLFGTLPAWRMSKAEPNEVLKSGAHTVIEGRRSAWMRELLVGTEVGLSFILVVAAGLLLTSFMRVLQVDKGFQTENLLTLEVNLPSTKYEQDKDIDRFYTQTLERIRALPGVDSAGLVSVLPLQGESWVDAVTVEGDRRPITERPQANYRFASPDYFKTIGIQLRRGRIFDEHDRERRTAVISEATAQGLWPGEDPIGKRFKRAADSEEPFEILGVVSNIRGVSLQQGPGLMVYVPYWQRLRTRASLVVRTQLPPAAMAASVRSAIWQVDDQVPVAHMQPMDQLVAGSVAQRRFQMWLVLLFAILALLLASVGIYGVTAESVARRTNEIGIRMALGASERQILQLVLRQGMLPVVIGLAVGLAGTVAMQRVLNSLLFEITASHPLTLIAAVIMLTLVGLLACYVPARRASQVDPMQAVRYE